MALFGFLSQSSRVPINDTAFTWSKYLSHVDRVTTPSCPLKLHFAKS
jgi:hypothetical protein